MVAWLYVGCQVNLWSRAAHNENCLISLEKVKSVYQRYLGDKLYIWKKTPEHQSDLVLDCSLYFHLTLFFYFLLHKIYLTHSYLYIYKHMICWFCRTRYCSTYQYFTYIQLDHINSYLNASTCIRTGSYNNHNNMKLCKDSSCVYFWVLYLKYI